MALLLAALAWTLGSWAENPLAERYNMLSLNMANGLPTNFVDDIMADSYGFIWIATHGGGLVRYDGYTTLDFGVGNYSWQLKSNSCRNLCEDNHQRLWIAFDEFTEVLDLKTLQPVVPHDKQQRLNSILKEQAMHVSCDATGKVWVVTMGNIYCISFHDDGSVEQLLKYAYVANTPDVFIADMEANGSMWVAFGGTLQRLAVSEGRIVSSNISPALNSLPAAFITDIVKHEDKYWIGTNDGLFCFDPYKDKVSVFSHDGSPNSLSHNYVASLAVTAENQLLVGTLSGIDLRDSSTASFIHCNIGDNTSPSNNFVNCLRTFYGQIWIGTEGGGVIHLVPQQLFIQNYTPVDGNPHSLSAPAVNAILSEADGTLWVGTVEGGLNRKRPGEDAFTRFNTSNTQLSHNSVSALAMDREKRLWVGTWAGGLNVLPLDKPEQLRPFGVEPNYQRLLNFIGALEYDSLNNGLWIGSNDGLYFYDMTTGTMTDPFDGCRNIRGCIGSIILPSGQLWMGCLEGAVVIDLKSRGKATATRQGNTGHGTFAHRQLKYKLDDPQSGIIDKITCFCRAADGTLWIGSNGYGLYRCDVDKDGKMTFKAYRMTDGLSNNVVKGIAEGQNGMLWISTMHGLSHFNPKTGVFTNFHEEDGLLSSQFYWNAAIRSTDGTLYFGSDKGLTAIYAESKGDLYKGQLHFTQLTVNNQVAVAGGPYIKQNIATAKRINLKESDRSFTIEFSALHYGNETNGIYYYRMKGFEEDWTPLPSGEHSVRYTSLPYGDYTFEVTYASALDNAQGATISIDVHVKPYFWKSWWFRLLVAIAFVAAVSYLLRQMQRRRQRQLELAKQQEAERLMRPIEKVLRESEDPQQLQQRIQSILNDQKRYSESSKKSVEADAEERMKNTKPFMERVMSIMEQNYMNSEFDVTEFCQQIGMSRSLLSRKLNEHTGQSTSQFIRNYRLDIARQILKRGDQRNIAEIAFSVGFNDPKYFTRCFSKLYGVSPSSMIE